jgi:alpha-beta hydrolase superfamily lysophospholipase
MLHSMRVISLKIISGSLELSGEAYIPQEGEKPYPAAMLCHGISAGPYNPAERSWPELAEKFCRAGFVSMIFNFRGAGKSQGNFDMLDWCSDLQAALDNLLKIEEADKERVYVLGSSAGGAAGIYTAAHDKRIAGLVTMGCPAVFSFIKADAVEATIDHFRNVGIIKDRDFPSSREEWLKHFQTVNPLNWVPSIAPRPLLLMHGDKDDVVPVEQAYQLFDAAAEPRELIVLAGAGHRLRLIPSAVDTALKWMQRQAKLISAP